MLSDLHVGQIKPKHYNTIKRQKAIGTLHVGQDKKQNQTLRSHYNKNNTRSKQTYKKV